MTIDRGNDGSLAGRLSKTLASALTTNFGIAELGVDLANGNGIEKLAQEDAAKDTAPEDMPHYDAKVGDVIRSADVEAAGQGMCELNDRNYKANIHLQECAMNAGNMELAEEIGNCWVEFSRKMGEDQTFQGEGTFVNGIKQAVSAHTDFVYDIKFLAHCDPFTAIEIRKNPEAVEALGRAMAGVHVIGEDLNDLANKVENDLTMARQRELSHDPSLQTTMQFNV
jgi:hypothetical protein